MTEPDTEPGTERDMDSACQVSEWRPTISRERYAQDIATIHDLIGRGETYQVNHTLRLRANVTGSEEALYRQLVRAQEPAYAAHLALGRYSVLSVSPELFFYRRGDHIVTRPMKGTIGRGASPEEDRQRADALAMSVKDRAENVMIVDLLRNDLGRLALPGSVRVSRLFDIEPYPNVWQMTSTIEARLPSHPQPTPTLVTLLTALFPCGSVTGAPKINTMRHIARLETTPRHIYCGAIGYLTPHTDPQQRETIFNVAIRTVLLDTHTHVAEYGVGGGITWDSRSDDEYAEILMKAKILKAKILNGNNNLPRNPSAPLATPSGDPVELELLESLRLEKGCYWLLDRHMERLERTASHFGYPIAVQEVRAQLDSLALQSLREETELTLDSGQKKSGENLIKTASNEIQNSPPSDKLSEAVQKSVPQNGSATGTGGKSGAGQLEEQHNLGDIARNTAAARQEQPPKIWKVRCLVSAAGHVRLERLELGPDGKFPLSVVLAQSPVSREEPLLYHKTTHRAIYDAHLAEAQARQCGIFDVLLWNAEGELTEFTQGNLVASVRGRLLTPPVSSGLLAGTHRAELLARGDVREKVILRDDLAHTTGMWLINSVRGWLPVRLLDNPYAHKRI